MPDIANIAVPVTAISVSPIAAMTYIDGDGRHDREWPDMHPTGQGLPALIRQARKALGWSQTVLAERTENSRDTIWRLENGGAIESDRLERILEALGLMQHLRLALRDPARVPRDPVIAALTLAYGESAEMRVVLDSIAARYLPPEAADAATPERTPRERRGGAGSGRAKRQAGS